MEDPTSSLANEIVEYVGYLRRNKRMFEGQGLSWYHFSLFLSLFFVLSCFFFFWQFFLFVGGRTIILNFLICLYLPGLSLLSQWDQQMLSVVAVMVGLSSPQSGIIWCLTLVRRSGSSKQMVHQKMFGLRITRIQKTWLSKTSPIYLK